ncbi:hypothetical protein ABS241_20775, partial [Acinetobacter baumannii]|uniref:hypothetical protein n=1 Tax=Acinetobacter baumannii TaxID=470 RepID=UPI003325F291
RQAPVATCVGHNHACKPHACALETPFDGRYRSTRAPAARLPRHPLPRSTLRLVFTAGASPACVGRLLPAPRRALRHLPD